jgi:PAS domain S-box-containing protein
VNREQISSITGGAGLSFSGPAPVFSQGASFTPGSDEGFQRLLLRIAAAASERSDAGGLIRLFCRATREFFQVSGVYFWRCQAGDEMLGEQADGKMAERFVGMRLRSEHSTVTAEAVRQRRTIFANHVNASTFPLAREFGARSLLAAPLVVFNEVIGATTYLHDADDDFFNEDLAAKATILAGQLGSLLEATRLTEASREEHRKAEILADVANALHGSPDVAAVIEALADRVRLLLRTRLVCVLLKREGPFELRAVSAETPQLANAARAGHDRQTLRFAADLAQRAVTAGEPITLSLSDDIRSLGTLISPGTVSPGMLIVAPLRSSRTQGAILVYPRQDGVFTAEEKTLVSAIAGFGAVAIAHAELYSSAHAQSHELQQLLAICSELGSSADLEHFLQSFVVHGADFLGFGRCFVALLEGDEFRVRYGVTNGAPSRVDNIFPEGVATKAIRAKEVFWTDDAKRTLGINLEAVDKFQIRQLLTVPLTGSSGKVLGMFGVLDRLDSTGISQEDIRRARALSNQAAVMLEVASNLHRSEQHRRRAEVLIELAREINGALRIEEFARRFVSRSAELTGSRAGVLALRQGQDYQVVACHPERHPESAAPLKVSGDEDQASPRKENPTSLNRISPNQTPSGMQGLPESAAGQNLAGERGLSAALGAVLSEVLAKHRENVISGSAEELLGLRAAIDLGWKDCTLMRLPAANSSVKADTNVEPAGVLCLSGGLRPVECEDRVFLETVAGHAAMALENARLFTQIEQANRHWMEIFDAIADFIVVHDQGGNVLRVNRALGGMIGVVPAELVGLNMRSLFASHSDFAPPHACPFCRPMADDTDEFVHLVFDRTFLVSTSRVHGAAHYGAGNSGAGNLRADLRIGDLRAGDEGLQTIHVLKDISDRREAERRYRELFDNIQEGLFFSTPSGRFVEVNDALVRMLGYDTREELLHVDIPSQVYFSPEQLDHHAQMMKEYGSFRNLAATLRRKDGTPIHVLINAFGLYDNEGQLQQIRGLILDVTGLRTSQSELHRERDFSAKILNNTQSLILVTDTAGLVSYANRRWADAGFEQHELLGRPLLELTASEFIRPLTEAVRRTLDGQQVDNLELQIMRGNGIAGKFSANLSPMRDEQGIVTSIVLVLTDITDSAHLRDKLVHAEKMVAVGQLVSGVAHEVNNPLTAILGFADLMMENPELPETARKDLRVILQEAQRTKQIVQNLLSFARQMPPERTAVQLNPILRRTIQLRSYDFTNHGVDVVEHLDEGLPEVLGDAQQLQQVFLNILNNAYDAVHETERAPRIEIMSTKCGEVVEVSFRDNGHGISHPERIFDPFFTTKGIGKGTGLGLSICYGIVKEHGGEILCHNNLGGQGATFVVRLPSASQAAAAGVTETGATEK